MSHEIKVYILEKLREAEREWVSGEVLRAPFGVSRMAVSKQVRALREKGYGIEAGTRKGYRLVSEAPGLYPESVLPRLKGTRFADGAYKGLEITSSTNDDVRGMAEAGAPEGSFVTAEVQMAGRGRRGRSWFGQQGDSLMVSLLLRPPLSPAKCGLLPLLAAVAAREALTELGVEGVGIKWPNDLILDGRKLAGILCEISSDFDSVSHAVIGLGMNVNTRKKTFPEAVRDLACSLRTVTGREWSRADILERYLRQMDAYLNEAWQGDFSRVLADWRAGSVTLGRSIEVTMPDGSLVKGKALDVDVSGALVFQSSAGEIRHLTGGEVSLGLKSKR
ncbi:MAG: biotin--[acetyl-CoA-carboxylase] ligase [Verrucomicrobia bacterium]|nr:biotin--[acetyl-CoA-carboxylase] ligase [Verrucomicrobiota bacterium]MCH8527517.1 biotin--[acetyl-CoA-carboxylase] ligase [Kiritimatiellia bacterium]